MSPATMTAAEYAAHRGCSDSYIRRMRRQGKLVLAEDGKGIRVPESDALLDSITNPVHGGDRTAGAAPQTEVPVYRVPSADVPSVQEAVRRERLAKAQLAELELGELSRALTRTREVERAVFTLVRQALNSMMGMSGRLRAKLAAESDPRAVEAMLDAEVRKIAQALQGGARQLLAGGAPEEPADAEEAA